MCTHSHRPGSLSDRIGLFLIRRNVHGPLSYTAVCHRATIHQVSGPQRVLPSQRHLHRLETCRNENSWPTRDMESEIPGLQPSDLCSQGLCWGLGATAMEEGSPKWLQWQRVAEPIAKRKWQVLACRCSAMRQGNCTLPDPGSRATAAQPPNYLPTIASPTTAETRGTRGASFPPKVLFPSPSLPQEVPSFLRLCFLHSNTAHPTSLHPHKTLFQDTTSHNHRPPSHSKLSSLGSWRPFPVSSCCLL